MKDNQHKKREWNGRQRSLQRYFRKLRRKAGTLWRGFTGFLHNIYLGLLLIAGILIVVGVVLFAFSISQKETAILVTAVGSVAGAVVFAFTLPAILRSKIKEGIQKAEDEWGENVEQANEIDRLREESTHQREEIISLEKEKTTIQWELEKQKRMHIEVDSIQPIEKVSFLEVKSMVTDVVLKELDRLPPDGVRKGSTQEYLGVLNTRFKANLGVDMSKIGFRINDRDQIVISGIRSEFQGFFIEAEDWQLFEIREEKWGGFLGQSPSKRILSKDQRLAELTIEQRGSLMDRLSMGVDFSYLDESIRKFTNEYLTVLLAPIGREIIFNNQDHDGTLPLHDFLQAHNAKIEDRIVYLKTRLSEVEQELLEEGDE